MWRKDFLFPLSVFNILQPTDRPFLHFCLHFITYSFECLLTWFYWSCVFPQQGNSCSRSQFIIIFPNREVYHFWFRRTFNILGIIVLCFSHVAPISPNLSVVFPLLIIFLKKKLKYVTYSNTYEKLYQVPHVICHLLLTTTIRCTYYNYPH